MGDPTISLSRRVSTTPFTPRVEAAGVKSYSVYNGLLLATAFRSREEDYWHLRQYVQLWDVSCERQVEIQGPDAARLVQLMTPRDLSQARSGRCFYAPLVDETGGMVNDPVVLKLAEDRFWLSIADSDVLLWAKGLAYGLGLEVEINHPEVFPLAIQGPKADDLAARVFGEPVRDLRFFQFQWLPFQDHHFLVARSGWSKQGGFEVYVDRRDLALPLWDALWQAGQKLNVTAGCPNLIERIEGGLLSYGNDMTHQTNPFECGLARYCSLDRPIEFMGRAALEAAQAAGLQRQIRGLKIAGGPLPGLIDSWPVQDQGSPVGYVTSTAFSPALDCNVALAMLDRSHWQAGSSLAVTTPAGVQPAEVSDLPFAVPAL